MYESNIYVHPTACREEIKVDGFVPYLTDDGTFKLISEYQLEIQTKYLEIINER